MNEKMDEGIELSSKISNERSERLLNKNNSNGDEKKKIIENILSQDSKIKRLTGKNTYFDLSNINASTEQKTYAVNINKRDYDNNFYINNIDQSIAYVIPYKKKCPLIIFIFLGIPYLITLFSNKKYVEYRGIPCHFDEAEFYLIIDGYGNYHICHFTKKYFDIHFSNDNFFNKFKKNIPTLFSNIEFSEKRVQYHEINYEYNTYFCYFKKTNELNNNKDNDLIRNNIKYFPNKNHCFESPVFFLGNVENKEIYNIFMNNFLTQEEINFQRAIYKENKLSLKVLNYISILLSNLCQFFSIYPILGMIFWFYQGYYFVYVVLISFITIILITSYQKYINKKSIVDLSLKKKELISIIKGKNIETKINYEDIVPGQIIKLKEGDILPCDCLLLEGFCSVVEASLTGESSSVMKYRLSNNHKIFKYNENQKSFLFCGTKIEKAFPEELIALVVGIGFNTQRGNLIQSVLFPKKSNFNFYRENINFFIISFFWLLISLGIIIYYYKTNGNFYKYSKMFIDTVFILFPPTLPISLTVGTFYYQYNLKKKKISCSDEYKLIAAGRVNKIIMDKTGTLTKEDLELYGYIATIRKNKKEIYFDSLEKNTKLYLSFLCDYYKNEFHKRTEFSNYEKSNDDEDNSMTYFLECLSTCHSITKINNEPKGNSIDMKIFENLKWNYEPIDKNHLFSDNDQFEMRPKKYFQITEEQFFTHTKNVDYSKFNEELNSYKLIVILRCPFDSRHQSMSVIVKNNFDNTIRLYMKGAPEKIANLCKDETKPDNFNYIHKLYTLQGFRVLACATKLISKSSENEDQILLDEKYKYYNAKDMTFLGFIIFQNRLKKNTKNVLRNLAKLGLFPIISTGDNAFTSISVVKECNVIEPNSKFCIMDINNEKEDKKHKRMFFKKKPSLNQNIQILKCSIEDISAKKLKNKEIKDFDVILNTSKDNLNLEKKTLEKSNSKLISITELNNIISKSKMKLCIHSRVFDLIFFRAGKIEKNEKKENEDLTTLRDLIVKNAILFFRMSPSDKSKLIQLYKKQNKNNIVAMCGDGANDCSALISADVGISLKTGENMVMTSHLMAKTKSITVVNDIIKIGRTSFENSTILLKIILLYSEVMTTYKLLLSYNKDDMTDNQYFFIDCLIIFFGCCLISVSLPNFKVDGKDYSNVTNNNKFLFSVLGHSIFQISLIFIYFYFILDNHFYEYYENLPNFDVKDNNISFKNSYCFILACFQNFSFVFVFNYFSVQKEKIYKNRILTLYLIIVLLIITQIISIDIFKVSKFDLGKHLVRFIPLGYINNSSEKSRIIVFIFGCLSFIYTMIWESISFYCFNDKYSICSNIYKEYNNEPDNNNNDDENNTNENNINKNNNEDEDNFFSSDTET
jgi:cation-transporting ATPase 13A3/4/5